MTFIVNQDGVVFQKDLGDDTATAVEAIQAFDPDGSWTAVDCGWFSPFAEDANTAPSLVMRNGLPAGSSAHEASSPARVPTALVRRWALS